MLIETLDRLLQADGFLIGIFVGAVTLGALVWPFAYATGIRHGVRDLQRRMLFRQYASDDLNRKIDQSWGGR